MGQKCKAEGCSKTVVIKGYCTGHADEFVPEAMAVKRASKQVAVVKAAVPAKPKRLKPVCAPVVSKKPVFDYRPVSDSFGKVENAAGEDVEFGATDPLLLEPIDRMMVSVRSRLFVEVSGMPFDLAAIHIIKTVEGMARRVA